MARIRCFLLEPSGKVQVKLRRYTNKDDRKTCPTGYAGYHNASTPLGEEAAEWNARGYISNGIRPRESRDDPRWPNACSCGYQFQEDDEWDRFVEQIYRRGDTGEEFARRDIPAGGMWFDPWCDEFFQPQSEHCLTVMTPGGGEWQVDGPASNCTMLEDRRQEKHHCWLRHGIPPDITVDKAGGQTCNAGAGSIQCGNYHGFLRNGHLED